MNLYAPPRRWLAVAATLIICAAVFELIRDPSPLGAGSVVLGVLLAALLFRGSKLAWVLSLIGAVGQLVNSVVLGEFEWSLVVATAILICVLAPSSIRFIWTDLQKRQRPERQALNRSYNMVSDGAYALLARIAGWEDAYRDVTEGHKRRYGLLIWRLGCCSLVLLALVGATYNLQQGAGHSRVVNIIADLTWTCWALVQFAFVAALLLAAYNQLINRQSSSSPSR